MSGARPRPDFGWLLAGLLLTLLAGPVGDDLLGNRGGVLVQGAFTATLLVSLWTLADARRLFVAAVVLALASLTGTVLLLGFGIDSAGYLSIVTLLAFCAMTLVFALRNVLVGGAVDANRLVGAVCVYLLAGIALSMLNLLIADLLPGSFAGLGDRTDAGELIYYTFVTMTTLGYGDVVPVRPLARTLGYLTAVAGQFYIAILVGLLIGVYLADQRPARASAAERARD